MVALYLLIALQVLDIASTLVALRNPKLREANKVVVWLFDRLGVATTLIGIKAAFVAMMWFLHQYVPQPVLWGLCVFYVWVVWNNVRVIQNSRKSSR